MLPINKSDCEGGYLMNG